MDFFKFIYYFIGVFFIFYELGWLLSPIEKAKDSLAFKALADANKGLKWDQYSEDYKKELKSKIWILVYLFWFVIGLFTFQWSIFLAFLVFNFIGMNILVKAFRGWFAAFTMLHWINSLIGLSFALFVIINAYHLKIDMYQYFLTFTR